MPKSRIRAKIQKVSDITADFFEKMRKKLKVTIVKSAKNAMLRV